ncbi:MAG TPA: hypothetical protein VE783_03735 [Candidatus Limnocylindrales bacterium]|jgi:hypothetical protein|nr:hypothetical protein [Candidatus Limnocylindrales bacterium]
MEKQKMNNDNRVPQRTNARELSQAEVDRITGGLRTLTICTIANVIGAGGDEAPNPETC